MSRRRCRNSSGFFSGVTLCENSIFARLSRARWSSFWSSGAPKTERSCVGFFFLSAILNVLPGDELGEDRQLVGGHLQGLLGFVERQAFDLKEDAARPHDGHPMIGGSLSLAHAGFGGVLRHGLVRENADPQLAALLQVAADRH